MGFFNGSDIQKWANVAAGTIGPFNLRGGSYVVETKSTGSGTIDLQRLSPDGSWRNSLITQITATSGYQGSPGTALSLSPGTYQWVISSFTANYIEITRVPTAIE
jgi:hypothetical protein